MIKTPQQLENLRDKIDIFDEKIITFLAKRTDIVREIGKLKKIHNIKPLDNKRFNNLLKSKLSKAKQLSLPEDFIKELYNLIHKYSLKIENNE